MWFHTYIHKCYPVYLNVYVEKKVRVSLCQTNVVNKRLELLIIQLCESGRHANRQKQRPMGGKKAITQAVINNKSKRGSDTHCK